MTSPKIRNRFELVTLMALIKHNIGMFTVLAQFQAVLEFVDSFPAPQRGGPLNTDPDDPKQIGRLVRLLLKESVASDNPLIKNQAERILRLTRKGSSEGLNEKIKDLYQRMQDLLVGQTFYSISPDKAERYEEPLKGWNAVSKAFPSAIDAIEEAEKCFALGRDTACVFHCLAIMDKGLIAFGRHLRTGVNPTIDTWENIIASIESAIDRKRAGMRKPAWKSVEAFYDEALSDLRSVKNAWRNPTMHFRRTYTEEQADKVLERVREFMAHLCLRVHERRAK